MIADGSTLWVYEADDAQAFKTPLRSSTLPAQVSFLLGEGKLASEFDAEIVHPPKIGQPGQVVLKMVPKTGTAAYRYLLFVVDQKTGQVVETVIYDQQGGTNTLRFSNLEQNRKIDDAKFKFTPPRGVKVVSPPSHQQRDSDHGRRHRGKSAPGSSALRPSRSPPAPTRSGASDERVAPTARSVCERP